MYTVIAAHSRYDDDDDDGGDDGDKVGSLDELLMLMMCMWG